MGRYLTLWTQRAWRTAKAWHSTDHCVHTQRSNTMMELEMYARERASTASKSLTPADRHWESIHVVHFNLCSEAGILSMKNVVAMFGALRVLTYLNGSDSCTVQGAQTCLSSIQGSIGSRWTGPWCSLTWLADLRLRYYMDAELVASLIHRTALPRRKFNHLRDLRNALLNSSSRHFVYLTRIIKLYHICFHTAQVDTLLTWIIFCLSIFFISYT